MSHRISAFAFVAAAAGAVLLAVTPALASVVYDFDPVSGQSVGASGSVSITGSDGVTIATFSSTNPTPSGFGGAFAFGPNGGTYSSLGNTVLSSQGFAGETLSISFSRAQTGLSFDFAIGDFFAANGGDSITVTANNGASAYTQTAAIPSGSGDFYPQGLFSISGVPAFTSLTVTASDGAGPESFAIANMTSVPLPAAVWMLLGGLGGLGLLARREARAQARRCFRALTDGVTIGTVAAGRRPSG
jgi:hypothetical protein